MSNTDKPVKACGWEGYWYQMGTHHHYFAKWAVKQPSEYFCLYHQLVPLSTFAGKAAFCGKQQ